MSKLEVGSSITTIGGLGAVAEAQATLCFSPPDREKRLFPNNVVISRASTIFSKRSKISCFSIPRFSHVNTTSVSVLTV